jgi:hypothetical protein
MPQDMIDDAGICNKGDNTHAGATGVNSLGAFKPGLREDWQGFVGSSGRMGIMHGMSKSDEDPRRNAAAPRKFLTNFARFRNREIVRPRF